MPRPKKQEPADKTAKNDTAFQRFQQLAKKIVSVPHAHTDKQRQRKS